ncbi:sugar phosphate isomerase/epimerase family protein [Flagellimonas allohymeniacidonis]|uniref:Sugar phosphate isomerase/epimerase n=1 Tax=Flagellimonas allohymeniacidonis TaxID=2517819 RepID=A0A4Q8QGN7_9FLAO|nr:sugar phosphate isomerase/epimerase family protein [Allomuricauda hymeniacidonis]TAI48398.1 sugar phosphate isomerase/epimerase [Allomuricauda hymeniacidonis]
MINKRRKFIKHLGAATALTPLAPFPLYLFGQQKIHRPLNVHLFSKHLHFLNVKEAAQISAELGFDGLDLTVRPKGHVLPENVETDLPKAVEDIKAVGAVCELITTAIGDVANDHDIKTIKMAAKLGIKFYRSNWFEYLDGKSMQKSMAFFQQRIKELGEVNKQYNIIGCYQNHAGTKIGASFWEVEQLLKAADLDYFGTQYDIRHAMVDSGLSWRNGLRLLHRSIKTIVLKDFKWGKVDGQWKVVNVPIGEGMVDFNGYFKLLKGYGLNPPTSLHLEYPLGGAEKGRNKITVDKKVVFDAIKKDLNAIQKFWEEA